QGPLLTRSRYFVMVVNVLTTRFEPLVHRRITMPFCGRRSVRKALEKRPEEPSRHLHDPNVLPSMAERTRLTGAADSRLYSSRSSDADKDTLLSSVGQTISGIAGAAAAFAETGLGFPNIMELPWKRKPCAKRKV